MAINPNWPVVEEAWAPSLGANAGTVPPDRMVSVTGRSRGQTSSKRGTQYELDQVQAGEYDTSLDNRDGALDPLNSAGPWYQHINPYQPYRKRAQWPPTVNLLTQFAATGGDLGGAVGAIPSSAAILSGTDASGGSVVASGTAWQGANVFQFAVPASTAAGFAVAVTGQVAVEPGLPYALQLRVRDVTGSTSVSVQAVAVYYNAVGSVVGSSVGTSTALTGGAAASWTQLTVVSTPPARTAYSYLGVQLSAASPASVLSVQVDGWQIEQGPATTAWVQPGVWYPIYAGFTESPQAQWDMGGTYGTVPMTCVDSLALLSQVTLTDPLTEEIQSHSPRFLYRLDDPAGSAAATDSTGTYPALPVTNGKYGASSITFGADITATDPANGIYAGSTGTVATLNNPSPGQNVYGPCTYLSLTAAGITGPAAPTGDWSRMIAFRYAGPAPAYAAYLWMCSDNQRTNGTLSGSSLDLFVNSTSHLQLNMGGPVGSGVALIPTAAPVNDGNWHLVLLCYSHAAAQLVISVDGVSTVYGSFSTALEPIGLTMDSVGAFVDNEIKFTTANFSGDVSFVAEFPVALSGTAQTNLYTAWKASCAGESTDARYARILRYAGYTGPTSIQTGLTTSMGPATEINGTDALSALQSVVDTESGAHFVARDGTVTFQSRASRYDAFTPLYTFGENTAGGEWPYEDVKLPYDPTHLANQVTITQTSTSQTFVGQDSASIAAYFPRTLTRNVNSSSALECQDAANYLVSRYKNPAVRIDALSLHPSALTGLWPVCLSLEIGMRIRVIRRPPSAPTTTVDCFIGSIQWDMDDAGEAFVTLQCTPADLNPYAIFAAWHTTLRTTIAAGATSITINASADNTNPLATQLGPGQQLVLGQNSTNQETVTVSAVGATSPGWTSAVITLTAATTKSHTAGDLINEPLPAGVTDPTAYDASSRFDSTVFAY